MKYNKYNKSEERDSPTSLRLFPDAWPDSLKSEIRYRKHSDCKFDKFNVSKSWEVWARVSEIIGRPLRKFRKFFQHDTSSQTLLFTQSMRSSSLFQPSEKLCISEMKQIFYAWSLSSWYYSFLLFKINDFFKQIVKKNHSKVQYIFLFQKLINVWLDDW